MSLVMLREWLITHPMWLVRNDISSSLKTWVDSCTLRRNFWEREEQQEQEICPPSCSQIILWQWEFLYLSPIRILLFILDLFQDLSSVGNLAYLNFNMCTCLQWRILARATRATVPGARGLREARIQIAPPLAWQFYPDQSPNNFIRQLGGGEAGWRTGVKPRASHGVWLLLPVSVCEYFNFTLG